jgi:hypothetical protein
MGRPHHPLKRASSSEAVRPGPPRKAVGATSCRLAPRLYASLAIFLLCTGGGAEAFNQELKPGSRLIFPYYDFRPGSTTLMFFTNVGQRAASVQLEMYDQSCIRRDANLSLSAGDLDLLDLHGVFGEDPEGTFRQGFLDAFTVNGDVLLGEALVVNATADWAISYPAAPTQQVPGSVLALTLEPYPTRLLLPAFLTPGSVGPSDVTDGLLILAAPHPTTPGADLQKLPIQAAITLLFADGESSSAGIGGHQVIVPIGQLVGSTRPPTLGWLDLVNFALDESGNPIGLVGLYIQTVVGPNGAMGMATRLWGVPTSPPGP